jgi:ubiquinone biosynthesis protein UbiJ
MSQSAAQLPLPLVGTILPLLGRALEALLDRALALDPASRERLAPLEGRHIELIWAPADLGLRLTVADGRVAVGPRQGAADLSLAGTLVGFARLAFPERAGALPPGKVQMAGDADLARTIGQLAQGFEPDLEAALGRVLGDTRGAIVATTLREAFSWARRSASTLAEDGADYLKEEARDLPAHDEVEAFHADVDRLRDDVERLAARLARVKDGLERGP